MIIKKSSIIPRYDLHRHLGGCLLPEFVYALANKHNLGLSLKHIRKSMTYQVGDPMDFQTFLRKFDILNEIKWDEQDIVDMAHHVVGELIRENVKYTEIRFSINKYLDHVKMSDVDLIRFIRQSFDDAQKNSGVEVQLLLSLKYEAHDRELQTAMKVKEFKNDVIGIDFVGDESKFDITKMKMVTDIWKPLGLGVVVHAGESQSAKNVRLAVEILEPQRIAHGIRVPQEDPDLLNLCRDKGICFDIAITSNILTGVCKSIISHPATKMLNNGNIITLGTDDPATCRSCLAKELEIAQEGWGLSDDEIHQLMMNSVRMALVRLL
jgi:adenosine deaminase